MLAVVVTVAVGTAIYNFFAGGQRERPNSYDGRCGGGDDNDYNYTFNPRTGSNPRPR